MTDHSISRPAYDLTLRELEIIGCLCEAMSNKDIAVRFGISEETVKRHMSNLCDKTGQSSRLEVAMFAVRNGLVTIHRPSVRQEKIMASIENIHQQIERDIAQSRLLVLQLAAMNPPEQIP